jgi:hypothetical protein
MLKCIIVRFLQIAALTVPLWYVTMIILVQTPLFSTGQAQEDLFFCGTYLVDEMIAVFNKIFLPTLVVALLLSSGIILFLLPKIRNSRRLRRDKEM